MADRRRQYYTDQIVQGYLLKGIVALQLVLALVMLLYMYSELNGIIDLHLYRVHPADQGALPELFSVLGLIMGGFLVANIVLMSFAHGWWSRYIRKTVGHFSAVLDRMLQLDFSALALSIRRRHPMAELVELWFEQEKARDQRLRKLQADLNEIFSHDMDAARRDQAARVVSEYRRLLKAG